MNDMRKKDKLYSHQLLMLIVVYRIMVGLTYLPALNTPPANQDVWVMLLLSIPYTILLPLPLLYLSNKFSNLNFLEYTERIMGKTLGKTIGILYALFLLVYMIYFSSIFIEILNTSLYNQTPTIVNTTIFILVCAYLVSKGLTNIGRLGELMIPFTFLVFFFLILLGIKNYDLTVFLPILKDSKFSDINKGAFISSLRYTDVIIFIMMIPYLKDKKDSNKIFLKSIIYSILIVTLTVIVVQATLGIEYAKRLNFTFYTFARLIVLGDAQGFDLLYILIWIIGNTLKISGYFYFITIALGTVTNKKNQIFIIPIAIVAIIAVVLIKDQRTIVAARELFINPLFLLSLIFIVILPLIILIVYFFRRKKS